MVKWNSTHQKKFRKIWINKLVKWDKQRSGMLYQIVDAGHFIQRENPQLVINAVKRLAE